MLYISTPVAHFYYDDKGNKCPADGISEEVYRDLDAISMSISHINGLRSLSNRQKFSACAELMAEYYIIMSRAFR